MSSAESISYAHCCRIACRATSSFYLSFLLLPRDQFHGMCALYAFLRQTDDLVDSNEPHTTRQRSLARWREATLAALAQPSPHPILPAVVATVRRYEIPPEYLLEAIAGAAMDLQHDRYATWPALQEYCHRVAVIVGLCCLRIWGCRDPRAEEPARQCGLAFQLTNILRDVAEDARRGRIYLPQEDLARFGCREADILAGNFTAPVAELVKFQAARAADLYTVAAGLKPLLPAPGRRAFGVMFVTYRAYLQEIARRQYNVFGPRIKLSRPWRGLLALRALAGCD